MTMTKTMLAALTVVGIASFGLSASAETTATHTNAAGQQSTCAHSGNGAQGSSACTGARGRTAQTGHQVTRNGDGSATNTRTTTGPAGHTSGSATTFRRQ